MLIEHTLLKPPFWQYTYEQEGSQAAVMLTYTVEYSWTRVCYLACQCPSLMNSKTERSSSTLQRYLLICQIALRLWVLFYVQPQKIIAIFMISVLQDFSSSTGCIIRQKFWNNKHGCIFHFILSSGSCLDLALGYRTLATGKIIQSLEVQNLFSPF